MVAQSLGSSAREVPLVLNGKYIQLGDFNHILHHGSNPPEIRLGFVIKRQKREINVSILIEKGADPTSMSVMDSTVFWGNRDEERFELKPSPVELPESEKQRTDQIVREQIDQGLFNYQIIKPKGIESHSQYEEAVSASLWNFLPGKALIRVKSEIRKITTEIEQVIEVIRATVDNKSPAIPVNWEEELSKEARNFIGEIRHRLPEPSDGSREDDYIRTLREVSEWEGSTTIDDLTKFIEDRLYNSYGERRSDELMNDLVRRMNGALPELQRDMNKIPKLRRKTELEDREFPSQYSQIIQQIRQVFRDQIFYLGPLRDDPRTIYGIPPLPNQRDVGLKGEYTAAMLNEHKDTLVDYPRPPSLEEKFKGEYQFKRGTLEEAVKVWLNRMGLAESFGTEMTSKVGYQLTVRPKGVQRDLDLMSLGVGVSQVLPTIVMALLAPEDSVLIFEQPEVHLHPKVQSVLGDFFLGIVGCGKQCIVETHSEYLIHRIRRRIAESNDRAILQQLGIYFVELENGVSKFSLVETNEYGAILDWPADFFDEAEKESSTLLSAAMEKRSAAMEKQQPTRRRSRRG